MVEILLQTTHTCFHRQRQTQILTTMKDPSKRLMSWISEHSQCSPVIQHIPGSTNTAADANNCQVHLYFLNSISTSSNTFPLPAHSSMWHIPTTVLCPRNHRLIPQRHPPRTLEIAKTKTLSTQQPMKRLNSFSNTSARHPQKYPFRPRPPDSLLPDGQNCLKLDCKHRRILATSQWSSRTHKPNSQTNSQLC